MRKLIGMLWLALAPALSAQDSGGPPPPDSTERERLRMRIEERFGAHVQQELGLTDDQAAKLRATEERFRPRRRAIMRRQGDIQNALREQMRPGQAANADSVRKMMDAIQANRAELVRLEQEQDHEIAGYLTPVQRARYHMIRERMIHRLAEIRRERGMAGGRRPGVMRPREGPRRRPRR